MQKKTKSYNKKVEKHSTMNINTKKSGWWNFFMSANRKQIITVHLEQKQPVSNICC